MYQHYLSLPNTKVHIDANEPQGAHEWWRHSIGHGGINNSPLPEKVVQGARLLKPRLLRTFIQEFFDFYPDHGVFDWSKLDPYMDALHRTGADVVGCITFKPPVLYPVIDQAIWRPASVEEWQTVIYELVRRYSVERKIVTYWEIGNETDIGEWGGCPYLIKEAEDYLEYYNFTKEPILRAFPEARIGGPAIASFEDPLLFDFIDLCHRTGTRLDFVSWHLYHDDPDRHKELVLRAKERLAQFGGTRPEMLVTEWSKSFDPVSIEELAMMPRRAAATAAALLAMTEAGLDWSFYYHVWDQAVFPEQFESFYKDPSIMTVHWNEIPHRFGLFGVAEEIRPQYFVYRMYVRMGETLVKAGADDPDIRVCAVTGEDKLSVMLVNYNVSASSDRVATVHIDSLTPGRKRLLVYRIDEQRMWDEERMELLPCERRDLGTLEDGKYRFQVYCPADSVTFVTLQDAAQ
ncbi:hypothetical protein GXP70_22320 [Paenibacillus lycopersici]|uniref:Glycosyl hydrolases family 39 N-terminal catalytic domain-containing protein n=1 Tax=Paenibacillus lycopersici TaxID=2704462 RepID=A0A6C0G0Q1_9BACL|nr:hypothetical protein [Paenibacillus lycopersici]QHT62447.1 hypothetical protein GXP70_22320 [Paenibacillus lycopersici]